MMFQLVLLTAVLVHADAAAPQKKPTLPSVVVRQLEPLGGIDPGTTAILTDKLVHELRKSGRFSRVVSPREMGELLTLEQTRQLAGCEDQSCLAEIAGALGVEQMTSGTVGLVEGSRVINVALLDTRTNEPLGSASITVRGEEQGAVVFAMEEAVVNMLGLEPIGSPPLWQHSWLYPGVLALLALPPLVACCGLTATSCVGAYAFTDDTVLPLFVSAFCGAAFTTGGCVAALGSLVVTPILALWQGRGVFGPLDHIIMGGVMAAGGLTATAGLLVAVLSVLLHASWLGLGLTSGGADRTTGVLFIAAGTATTVALALLGLGGLTVAAGATAEAAAFLSRQRD